MKYGMEKHPTIGPKYIRRNVYILLFTKTNLQNSRIYNVTVFTNNETHQVSEDSPGLSLREDFYQQILIEIFRRAKEKRLKKDAGRARWGQYFRGLKGPISPGREKRAGTDSDRDSELELDYAQCEYQVVNCPPSHRVKTSLFETNLFLCEKSFLGNMKYPPG